MKAGFNKSGQMTYASRQEELEAHAKQIDAFLRTPRAPGVHFTPDGTMRRNGTQLAHDVMTQKRVDIAKELQQLSEDRAKRMAQDLNNLQSQTQGKSL